MNPGDFLPCQHCGWMRPWDCTCVGRTTHLPRRKVHRTPERLALDANQPGMPPELNSEPPVPPAAGVSDPVPPRTISAPPPRPRAGWVPVSDEIRRAS